MRTIQEMIQTRTSRDKMTERELDAFNQYLYEKYEKEGFSKYFHPTNNKLYQKKKYKVLGRVRSLREDFDFGIDAECLPLWHIELENGVRLYARPEEIIPSKIRELQQLKIIINQRRK